MNTSNIVLTSLCGIFFSSIINAVPNIPLARQKMMTEDQLDCTIVLLKQSGEKINASQYQPTELYLTLPWGHSGGIKFSGATKNFIPWLRDRAKHIIDEYTKISTSPASKTEKLQNAVDELEKIINSKPIEYEQKRHAVGL
jgi:hypothetical protein